MRRSQDQQDAIEHVLVLTADSANGADWAALARRCATLPPQAALASVLDPRCGVIAALSLPAQRHDTSSHKDILQTGRDVLSADWVWPDVR